MANISRPRPSGDEPIVITGMGVYCGAGQNVPALWESVSAGRTSAGWFHGARSSGFPRIAVCAAPPLARAELAFAPLRKMDRSVQMAWHAARQAWLEARLEENPVAPHRIAVIAGTSRGPLEKWTESVHRQATGRMLPTLAANSTLSCLSGALSLAFQAQGTCLTVSSACASGAGAIALGAQLILAGTADVVLAGGAEAPLQAAVLAQLDAARILGHHEDPQRTCRPFDRTRNGTMPGEGAGFVVLESAASARRRGSVPQAVLRGWAMGNDATGRTAGAESGEGLHRVMSEALAVAGLAPAAIDYVNVHGTGTVVNDRLEGRAILKLLGEKCAGVPCSSTKPVTGHCLGASSAIEAIISVLALRHQWIPPTLNCQELEPGCPLNIVREKGQRAALRTVLSTASGFWSHHAALVFQAQP